MLANNLKYLRKRAGESQLTVAQTLGIPRTTYSEYEKGNTEPNINLLVRLAEKYNISVDALLKENLVHQDLEILRNKDIRVLAMTVDASGKKNIELVETKAEAGYLAGFSDPEYISELPKIQFPRAPEGNYRAFEIRGESMLPLESGSIVICRYLEQPNEIKYGRTYIVVTHTEGVVYKRLEKIETSDTLLAISDNRAYPPYLILKSEIQELWQYYAHIGFNDVKATYEYMWEEKISDIQSKVQEIYNHSVQSSTDTDLKK